MQKILLKEAKKYAKQNYRRRIWRKFVRIMACVVVFCTTYALILPAITLEKTEPIDTLTYTGDDSEVTQPDSSSVTGEITLGSDPITYGGTTEVEWFCGKTTLKTLTVYAQFGDGDNKSICVKVPTGFQIVSYSARDDTPEIDGVTKVEIDNAFKGYVRSSELQPASLSTQVKGVIHEGTWESQTLTGYTAQTSNIETDYRTHGGDILYTLLPETQTVRLVASLRIDQNLLSHTSAEEQMESIEVIITSDGEENTSRISAMATDIPIVNISTSSGVGGAWEYNSSEVSEIEGRSDIIPIGAAFSNYLQSTSEIGSYFEEAEFCLTYPEGVFLEPDSVFLTALGYPPDSRIPTLSKNGTTVVVENHLSVEWTEGETGGGTVTWIVTEAHFNHSYGGTAIGANFRANTDDNMQPSYHGGDTITGFKLELTKYIRNGKERESKVVEYKRGLISPDDGKDIRLMPLKLTRRDITEDFQTEDYDYGLGGYDVHSTLPYTDNTFYFENVEGLKITALSLMGKDARNIVVITNKERRIELDEWTEKYSISHSSQYRGNLLELSEIGGEDGEYIKACLFTVDLDQLAYQADYQFGAFVYIGQFQDGDEDGSREGDVTLRLLLENPTYDEVQEAIANDTLDTLTMINNGTDINYGQKPIVGTDHTQIGWTNTGVASVKTIVKNAQTSEEQSTYYGNDRLRFETNIASGYNFRTQDTLIDPVLVISLPEGLSLDTTSVFATSVAGQSGGTPVQLVQDGAARETVIKEARWRTYRFRVPEDQRLALVATERFLNENTPDPHRIYAYFDVVVDPVCEQYDLSLQDIVMWDVRNTAYEEDTLTTVTESGVNGDAVESHWSSACTRTDKNNFLGHGTLYKVANNGNTIVTKPLIGLTVDLGIKPVATQDAADSDSDFTTYNGLLNSVAPVIPDKYADVRLNYLSTSDDNYLEGTVIYLPIPKKGVDYTKYFENVNLTDPMNNDNAENTKTFGFTMDLTEAVELSNGQTEWKTLYALRPVSTNPKDREIVSSGEVDTWEPVVQEGNAVTWLTADEVGVLWDQVAMVKFVAQDEVAPNETGSAIMRLYVHNLDSEDGPALGGTYNYWRGYSKAVTNGNSQSGNWNYTSVVAATPAMETLTGQIFIDTDLDGLFDTEEKAYSSQIYLAELSKVGGGMEVRNLVVKDDGSFKLVDSNGEPEYLTEGNYTVTIRRNSDPNFHFANTEYSSSIGKESPADAWHNNVSIGDNLVATWNFEVTNSSTGGTVVHRVGVAVKAAATVKLQGVKTFLGGQLYSGRYNFLLTAVDGALVNKTSARNTADGNFDFGTITYEETGTFVYEITEDCMNPHPGILYDYHTTTVTVTVTEDPATGILTAAVSYDNSTARTDKDRAVTDWAAFTNETGYELPETGGAGTYLYTMGGLLMMVAAAILLYIKNLKVRKEEPPSF